VAGLSLFRGIFPDYIFNGIVRFLKINRSMESWTGRDGARRKP